MYRGENSAPPTEMPGHLGFRNSRDRNLDSPGLNGKLGALTRRRILREPFLPLFIHPLEIVRVAEDKGCADYLVERAAGRSKDCLNVFQALGGLFLDGAPHHFAGDRVEGTLARNEDEPVRLYGLAVCCQ